MGARRRKKEAKKGGGGERHGDRFTETPAKVVIESAFKHVLSLISQGAVRFANDHVSFFAPACNCGRD